MSDVVEQAPPVPNDKPALWDLVIADMKARDQHGRKHYGTPLQPDNGRKMLVDAYQESLDMCVYLKGEIVERERLERRVKELEATQQAMLDHRRRCLAAASNLCAVCGGIET